MQLNLTFRQSDIEGTQKLWEFPRMLHHVQFISMPRVSYGPRVKARAMHLLNVLLAYAENEWEKVIRLDLGFQWLNADSSKPALRIEAKLRVLHALTQDDPFPEGLTKVQIVEALKRMDDYLEILEDNRIQTQGKEDWRFTLMLWSRDRETNLKEFDKEWERRRPSMSRRVLGEGDWSEKKQLDGLKQGLAITGTFTKDKRLQVEAAVALLRNLLSEAEVIIIPESDSDR